MTGEDALIAGGAGKWGQPDFPKTDWVCVETTDLGEPDAICEMCEYQRIRYVHHMRHPTGRVLLTGCKCAGNMTGDMAAAVDRDKAMKSAASRRKSLEKDRGRLRQLQHHPSALRQLEGIRRRALDRVRMATADYEAAPSDGAFVLELDSALFAQQAQAAVEAARQQQPQNRLSRELADPEWWPTPKGQRLETSQGDRLQAFRRVDGGYGFGYELSGRKMKWSRDVFASLDAAKRSGLREMTNALRAARRLPRA